MPDGKFCSLSVVLLDQAELRALREVLSCEASLRGEPVGAALFDVLMEAADVERYPEPLRAALAELGGGRQPGGSRAGRDDGRRPRSRRRAMSGGRPNSVTFALADQESLDRLRAVLAYESAVRGATVGQTLCELLMEAADVESYPRGLRETLAGHEERKLRDAAKRAVSCLGRERSA